MNTLDKARELQRLHADPELLVLVNVWDVITAKVVGRQPRHDGARHGEPLDRRVVRLPRRRGQIPRDEMIAAVGRIAAAVDLPVTADLEAGYGDAGETVRRAIDVGIVGVQPRGPAQAARRRRGARSRLPSPPASAAGVPFVLNARTDAFLRAGRQGPRRRARRRDRARPRLPRRRRLDLLRARQARRGDGRGARRRARAAEGQPHRRPGAIALDRDAGARRRPRARSGRGARTSRSPR